MLHDIEPTKDIPNRRVVDNTPYILTRKDPYGFWFVSVEKGNIPQFLTGSYTTYEEAKKNVLIYLERQGKVALKGV